MRHANKKKTKNQMGIISNLYPTQTPLRHAQTSPKQKKATLTLE